jgi:hypothetical protein
MPTSAATMAAQITDSRMCSPEPCRHGGWRSRRAARCHGVAAMRHVAPER